MPEPDHANPAATASYIEDMCGQMRDLATRSGFRFLAYLLDMARQEATACTTSEDAGATGHR